MKNKVLPYIIGTTLALGGANVDMIPVNMTLDHSYSTECSALVATTTTNKTIVAWDDETPYKPDVCDGNLYVSVFKDFHGKKVYQIIPEVSYKDMGKKDGYLLNTKKDELISAIEYTTQIASAAITHDAYTSCRANPATSCTIAHTVTGSNTAGALVARTFPSSASLTGCTWNGTTVPVTTSLNDGTANRWSRGHYITAPTTGNVVCSISASSIIYHSESSYAGVSQTGQPFASSTATVASSTSISGTLGGLTITEQETGASFWQLHLMQVKAVTGNDWLIGTGEHIAVTSITTAGANTVLRGLDPDWATSVIDSNNTTPTGGASPVYIEDIIWFQ